MSAEILVCQLLSTVQPFFFPFRVDPRDHFTSPARNLNFLNLPIDCPIKTMTFRRTAPTDSQILLFFFVSACSEVKFDLRIFNEDSRPSYNFRATLYRCVGRAASYGELAFQV